MTMIASWLQSLISPFTLKFSPQLFRRYGFVLSEILNGSQIGKKVQETESNVGWSDVEKIIGYSFKNKKLLDQAFTHPSFNGGCISYERLEYVGDSVLNLLITKKQFLLYPDLPPGSLTPLRAANVDTERLARVAVQHGFHKYLRYKKPVIARQIHSFINGLPKYPLHSHGLIDAPKVLADVVESTIGAVFIDSNASVDAAWEVTSNLLEPFITPEMLQMNPVKKLYELCQKHKLGVRFVDLWSKEGSYEVFIDNRLRGRGECHRKKEIALNRAANVAYNEIVRILDVK